MALPLSGALSDSGVDEKARIGVLSSYSDSVGCLAEVLDLTILPNGQPGIVVLGLGRIRVLSMRRSQGQFNFGAIDTLSAVEGDLSVPQNLINSFMETVRSAGIFRSQCPTFSSSHKFTAIDLYSIANKLCPGLERINILKADSIDGIFELLKRCIPGASLFSGNFGVQPTTAVQPVL